MCKVFINKKCLKNVGINPLSANPQKMVKHTQTIRRQFADELLEWV